MLTVFSVSCRGKLLYTGIVITGIGHANTKSSMIAHCQQSARTISATEPLIVGGETVMETTPNTKIEKNGLTFDLVRDETKAKEGRENVCFWNLPSGATLSALNDEERKAMVAGDEASAEYKNAASKVIDTYCQLLGLAKVIDYIVARVDATMRSAQLEQGKDNWSMEQKLERARDYVLKSDFGRNRQGGISALANKLESAKVLSSVQADLITKYQALTLAKTDADKASIQAEILVLMGKLTTLTK